jgi:uncharacterized RDD family membrane protein YckC
VVLTVWVGSPASTFTVPTSAYAVAGVGVDDGQRIVSGEAVELDIRVARLGSRTISALIDAVMSVVVFGITWTLISLVASLIGALDAPVVSSLLIISLVTGLLIFPTVTETLTSGRSLGKAAMGLRVVCDDGGPITVRHAFTRALINVAIEWPGLLMPPITWLATIGVMVGNPSGKRIGDLAAGTIVIHERTPASWGWVPPMPPSLGAWATTLDMTGMDDRLILAIRHYLSRNREIREPARTALGKQLAREVSLCTTPPPPVTAAGWEYLAAVLAERNRRAQLQMAKARAAADLIWTRLGARPRTHRVALVAPEQLRVPPPVAVQEAVSPWPAASTPPGWSPPPSTPTPPIRS